MRCPSCGAENRPEGKFCSECGAPLVRMETKVFLEKLIARFPDWHLAGDERRSETVLRSGWIELPVVFGS